MIDWLGLPLKVRVSVRVRVKVRVRVEVRVRVMVRIEATLHRENSLKLLVGPNKAPYTGGPVIG